VVDNTFLSPGWQQPLTLGADLVVHSTTKYINGHSDVVGGAVIARDAALAGELTWWANCLGLTGAPFDSFMTLRGLRTLHARLEHHGRNAQALAGLNTRARSAARVVPRPRSIPGTSWRSVSRRWSSLELEGGHEGCAPVAALSAARGVPGGGSPVAHPKATHAAMTHARAAPASAMLVRRRSASGDWKICGRTWRAGAGGAGESGSLNRSRQLSTAAPAAADPPPRGAGVGGAHAGSEPGAACRRSRLDL
jgi:hypothetical protein